MGVSPDRIKLTGRQTKRAGRHLVWARNVGRDAGVVRSVSQ